MKRDYIPINKDLVPYTFDIDLGEEMFKIRVDYNSKADLFTLALYKNDILICAGEPVIYGVELWKDVYKPRKFPILTVVPLDESGASNAVTFDNLGNTVFLTIDDRGD